MSEISTSPNNFDIDFQKIKIEQIRDIDCTHDSDGEIDSQPLHNKTVHVEACPVSVFDVAAYILEKLGTLSTIKLQKLVYYSQAWSLVWDDAPLFHERIEAWVNGPVVRELFSYHRGFFQISTLPIGVSKRLNSTQKETVDAVIDFYGPKTGQQLVEISHLEDPWKLARRGMDKDERGETEIPLDSIAEYYTSISKK